MQRWIYRCVLGLLLVHCILYMLLSYNNKRSMSMNIHKPLAREEFELYQTDEMVSFREVNRTTDNMNIPVTQSPIEAFGDYKIPAPDCDGRLLIFNFTTIYGLGDRQSGILSAFILALWKNRTFGIISESFPLTKYFIPNQYDWTQCITRVNLSSDDVGYVNVINKYNSTYIEALLSSDIWEQRIVVLFTHTFLVETCVSRYHDAKVRFPWFINYSPTYMRHVLHHFLFKLEPHFKLQIDNYIKHITNNGSLGLVGVHIRYYYTVGHPEYIDQVLDLANKYNDVNKYVIYIASENSTVRQRALDRFKGSHSLDVTGVTLHVGRATKIDTLFLAAFEQQLLSRSDVIIKTRSVFSSYATVIRGEHGGVLFRVED